MVMAAIRSNGSELMTLRRLGEAARRGRITRREAILRGGALGLSLPAMMALHSMTGPIGAMAASRQDDGAEPVAGGTLNLAVQADPAELDPHKTSLTAAWHVIEHVYD